MKALRIWLIVLAVATLTFSDRLIAAEMGRVQARHANVRKAPTAESAVIAVLDQGAEVEVIARIGAWLKVSVRATAAEGFVHASLVQIAADESRGAIVGPKPVSPPASPATPPGSVPPRATTVSRETRSALAKPRDERRLHVRVFGHVSYVSFGAKHSFEAILGSSAGTMLGGGIQVRYRAAFLQLGVSRYSKSGERVFEFEGQTYPLGIRDTVSVTPLTIIAGARVLRRGRLDLYVGAGIGRYDYKETSDFEADSEGVHKSLASYHVVGGVEFRLAKWVAAGLEGHYVSVPNAIGLGGVSAVYGETNLGNAGVQLKVLVGR